MIISYILNDNSLKKLSVLQNVHAIVKEHLTVIVQLGSVIVMMATWVIIVMNVQMDILILIQIQIMKALFALVITKQINP